MRVVNGSWDPMAGASGYIQPNQHAYIQGNVSGAGMGLYGQAMQEQPILAPNAVVRILYDYVATERGVLSLRAGDVATFLEIKDQGWCILKTTAGQEGYFPQSYIEPAGAIAAVGTPAVASNVQVRCEVHNKNRSAANLMQEPNPLTNGVTMRWVCKPGMECKGAVAVAPPSAAQRAATQASQAQMLAAAQQAAAEYMAKHAGGQKPPDGTSAWALPGYMTAGAAVALSSGKPLSASGLTPEQLKAAAEATALALAGKGDQAAKLLIPSAKVLGRMVVLAPFQNTEGAPNTITTLKTGDVVDLLQPDDKGWTMIKTRENVQGYYPTAFLQLKEGTAVKKAGEGAAAAHATPAAPTQAAPTGDAPQQEPAHTVSEGGESAANGKAASKGDGDSAAEESAEENGAQGGEAPSTGGGGELPPKPLEDAAVGTKRTREEGEETGAESHAKAACP